MNFKDYLKQKLVESLLNETRKRDFRDDPKGLSDPSNFGIKPEHVPPGSFVSHGDIFDKSDVIWHHTNMLKYALQSNDTKSIEKHTKAIKNAGGDPDSIVDKIRRESK
jgi:hypothetical protein